MRPKDNYKGEYNAFWYTLVSEDTDEMMYIWKR